MKKHCSLPVTAAYHCPKLLSFPIPFSGKHFNKAEFMYLESVHGSPWFLTKSLLHLQ